MMNELQTLIRKLTFEALARAQDNGFEQSEEETHTVAVDLLDHEVSLEGADVDTVARYVEEYFSEQRGEDEVDEG